LVFCTSHPFLPTRNLVLAHVIFLPLIWVEIKTPRGGGIYLPPPEGSLTYSLNLLPRYSMTLRELIRGCPLTFPLCPSPPICKDIFYLTSVWRSLALFLCLAVLFPERYAKGPSLCFRLSSGYRHAEIAPFLCLRGLLRA